jgi:hypothetical protein
MIDDCGCDVGNSVLTCSREAMAPSSVILFFEKNDRDSLDGWGRLRLFWDEIPPLMLSAGELGGDVNELKPWMHHTKKQQHLDDASSFHSRVSSSQYGTTQGRLR